MDNVHVLSHACPVTATPKAFEQRRNLLFIGALPDAGCPNAEGLIWFCGKVLPLLKRKLGDDISVIVAGYNGLERGGALASDNVVFRGVVSDIEPLYDDARIFVAPIRYGAGIPIKICEAAAHGLPVVTTTLCASQLCWQHGNELLVADSAERFAEECARAYTTPVLWSDLRSAALKRMANEHSIDAFASSLMAVVEGAKQTAVVQ